RRVLLPAPLRPIMPTTSPGCTENETSLSAQNSELVRERLSPPRLFRKRAKSCSTSSRMVWALNCPRLYRLERFSTSIMGRDMRGRCCRALDRVYKGLLDPVKDQEAGKQHQDRDAHRER